VYRSSPESIDGLNQLLKVDTKIYLPDDILVKVDRMSMAHSLEARTPFLDYRLVEFAGTLPLRLKQTHREGKVLLKRAMSDRLPPGIVRRRKAGFNVPAAIWLRGPLCEVAGEYLGEAAVRDSGVFDPRVIPTIWREHVEMRRDWSREIFGLLMFQLWHRHVYKEALVGVCV
jgi:asparagine synthase (glutamine-hydrolysing)